MKRPTGIYGFLPAPPTLARTAARALVSCAIAQRIELEQEAGAEAQQLVDAGLQWLQAQGLARELEPAEHALLATPLGQLDAALRDSFGARAEAACVIGWALRRTSIPGFDTDADGAAVAESLGWLGDDVTALATETRLRHRDEVAALLDILGAVHWRLRERSVSDAAITMTRWTPGAYAWPEDVTPLELADEDLALGAVPIRELAGPRLFSTLLRIRERHRAASWLLGQERLYGEIGTG
jgi:hypothetical protein